MIRKVVKILFVVLILLILWGIYWISTFDVLPIEKRLLTRFRDSSGNTTYEIFAVAGNAVTGDAIQLSRVKEAKSTIICTIDDFNDMKSFKLLTDTSLRLVLSDTLAVSGGYDTLIINLTTGRPRVLEHQSTKVNR